MTRSDIRKLHLGCGSKEIPGWFHVDALDYPHVGHRGPVEDLSFIADGSVELIYASHVLEHFGRRTYMQALKEWRRVLAPGGVLVTECGEDQTELACDVLASAGLDAIVHQDADRGATVLSGRSGAR